jgi:hypothetical protein
MPHRPWPHVICNTTPPRTEPNRTAIGHTPLSYSTGLHQPCPEGNGGPSRRSLRAHYVPEYHAAYNCRCGKFLPRNSRQLYRHDASPSTCRFIQRPAQQGPLEVHAASTRSYRHGLQLFFCKVDNHITRDCRRKNRYRAYANTSGNSQRGCYCLGHYVQ